MITVVLGAPKSGTSVMASALKAGGMLFPYTGKPGWRTGPGGYDKLESDIISSYFQLTRGSAWEKGDNWSGADFLLIQKAFSLHGERVGWKFPVSTLYWQEMRETCPELEFVGIFRNREAVCRHLTKHKYIPYREASQAWDLYAEVMLAAHETLKFPLFEFAPGFKPEHVQAAMGLNVVGDPDFRDDLKSDPDDGDPLYQELKDRAHVCC